MQEADRPAFAAMMSDVLAFHRQALSRFALGVWWQACQPFDFEQVTKALSAHVMDPERGRFPPMPADIVRQLQGTQTDRALVAWGRVYEAMQRVGAYADVAFDDPAIHAVVHDLGGWPAMCRGRTEDLPHLQRRFCEAYRAYAARGLPEYPPVLRGVASETNALTGQPTQPPVLVGQRDGCQRVMAAGGTRLGVVIDGAVKRVGAKAA